MGGDLSTLVVVTLATGKPMVPMPPPTSTLMWTEETAGRDDRRPNGPSRSLKRALDGGQGADQGSVAEGAVAAKIAELTRGKY
jgi:hypothetical protein